MKKILTSASLAALGAVGLHAQPFYAPAPYLTQMEMEKPWSVSVALRGFYDDNYVRAPRGLERDSFGFELNPTASYRMMMEQTFIGLSYSYSMRYYDDRDNNRADHSHQFDANLAHSFNDRFKLEVSDSFVISQEPTILEQGGPITGPLLLRSDQDNIRNRGTIDLKIQATEKVGLGIGYSNLYFDYDMEGPGGYSALLDRMEHLVHLDLRFQVYPNTFFLTGYQYGQVDHNSNDSLALFGPFVDPEIRDSRSHYFYVGADHTFSDQLSASARLGAQYTDYHNLDQDEWGPYAEVNATYTYVPGSYVQLGIRHTRNQTDIAFASPDPSITGESVTLDQESTTLYGTWVHKITEKLVASVIGQYQHGEFNGGVFDNSNDEFYLVGLHLAYSLNRHFSLETGYNYDRLDSDIAGREYDRNRVFIGARASF
jgi:hypothetical protein